MADLINIHTPIFWIVWSLVVGIPLLILADRRILSWGWVQRVRAARLNKKREL